MSDNFLDEYPLDYLITNKDKKSDYYILLHNICVDLLDGHKPDNSELSFAWNSFRMFVALVSVELGNSIWKKIYNAFSNTFNHTSESHDEFMKCILSDMINEFVLTPFDWESIHKSPIKFPTSEGKKRTGKPRKKDENIEIFFRDYVNQGGGHIKRPSEQDIQVFAKETLQLIDEPKTKQVLREISFGRFIDWLPEEIQRTLDSIGKLTLRDGKMLIAAKPLVENFREGYYASQSATVDQNAGIQGPQKPTERKKGQAAKVDFIQELNRDGGLSQEKLEEVLGEFSLEYILAVKDRETDLYTFICNMCVNLLHHPSESQKSFAWKFLRDFYKLRERGATIESYLQIPDDEDLRRLAEITLKIMEEPKRKKDFKSASLGRWRDLFPEEIQETFDEIGEISYKDAKMLIKAKPLLQQWESTYLKSKTLPMSVDEGQVIEPAKPENNLRCPKRGNKRFAVWQATWHKVMVNYKRGDKYNVLARLAGVGESTIADIVKAGDAGLLD